jgi:phage-related protein
VTTLDHLYLLNPATGERLDISPRSLNGGVVALGQGGIDFGFPAIRAVEENRAGQSGTFNYTTSYGSRTITLNLKVIETAAQSAAVTRRVLRGWMSPLKDPQLVWQFTNDSEMYADMVSSDLSAALNQQAILAGHTDVVLTWTVPRGRFLSTTVNDILIPYSGVATGRTYPFTPPRTYPAATGVNSASVLNGGTEATYPIVRLFGPMSAPKIANETTGLALEFIGLTIAAGDYIEINLENRTVQLNGVAGANANRRSLLTTRGWWSLVPGYNIIRYSGSGSIPAQGELLSQDAFL